MDYLLDTNHCIYLINGLDKKISRRSETENRLIEKVRRVQSDIFMSEATLGELYFGAANSGRREYNFQRTDLLKQAVIPIAADEDIWKCFGDTKAAMRKQGKPMTDLDILIACTARLYGLVLVTNDSDFDGLPDDFQRENWSVTFFCTECRLR